MNKENLFAKEFLPTPFDDFPENLKQVALSLTERAKKISFKPLEYKQALLLLPELKQYSYFYKESLENFAQFVPKKNQDTDDFFHREIRDFLTHKMGRLITSKEAISGDQREIINKGKGGIDEFFEKNSVGWNAIYSFWFNCLRDFCPQEEIFQIKTNPFVPLLDLAEREGIARTDQPEFLIDIPLVFKKDHDDDYFYGCWSPFKENSIVQGHLSSYQDCSCRKPLENGQLIVDNKDNAQS